MSDPQVPTAYPLGMPRVFTEELTRRVRAIATVANSKPGLELAEVTAVSPGSGITVKKIGTTVTIPGVKIVGWASSIYPAVGEFVWLLTLETGAQPFAIGVPAPELPRCKVYLHNNALLIANVFPGTILNMDSTNWTEEYEKVLTHDFVTNNSRITITRSGCYLPEACVTFDANGTGIRAVNLAINGTGIKTKIDNTPSAIFPCTVDVSVPLELAAGDYVEMSYVQNSGGNIGVLAGRGNTYLAVHEFADVA